jgi:hypothetical protein
MRWRKEDREENAIVFSILLQLLDQSVDLLFIS